MFSAGALHIAAIAPPLAAASLRIRAARDFTNRVA